MVLTLKPIIVGNNLVFELCDFKVVICPDLAELRCVFLVSVVSVVKFGDGEIGF